MSEDKSGAGSEMRAVAGGIAEATGGKASFSFSNTASGTTAAITGTATQTTTASSASQSGSFTSSSS